MKKSRLLLLSGSIPLILGLVSCSNAHANVGLLYCSAEANSVYQVETVKAELEKHGLSAKLISFSDSNDIQSVLEGSIDKVDTLYIPTDNTCAANSTIISKIVRDHKVPVFAGEEGICKNAGAITLTISYYNIGVQTGKMAIDVLLGKKDIKTMPIQHDDNPIKKYNKEFCESLEISVPSDYVPIGDDSSKSPAPEVTFQNVDNKKFNIGISQFVVHDALDTATKGFMDAVKIGLGEENVTFDYQNAAAQIDLCTTIANTFVSHKVDLIMANATPSLQAAANATKDIPILGTSVTEYGIALAIKDFDGTTGTNVSGTSDLAPLDVQTQMLVDVFSSYFKK